MSALKTAPFARAIVGVVAVLAVLVGAHPAAADTPAEDLARARASFREHDYAAAIPLLNYLLYPSPRLARVDDLIEAHLLYGGCSFEVGDPTTARREFEEALYLEGDLELDAVLYSPGAVKFFDETRAVITERTRLDGERRQILEERDRYQQLLASLVIVEKRSYYVNFIPFGAGQFQNRQPRKGLAFAVSEGLTGATSAGLWLYLVGKYGFTGTVPRDQAASVRRLQQYEIVSGTACLALIAWSIVDSLVHYQPSAQRKPDESLLPPELRRKRPTDHPTPAPLMPSPPPTSWLLAPSPLPGGAALSLTVEF